MVRLAFGFDGSVRIKADLDHSYFDRGIAAMTNKVNSFGATLKKVAGMVAVAFGTAAIINFGKEAVNAASALNDAWIGLQSIVEGQGKSFSKAKSFINEYISDGLVPLEDAVTSYKNLAARGYSTEQIEKVMASLKDAAAFGRQSSYSLGEAVSSATEGLKNENSILVDNAGVTKNVAKMWQEYAASIGVSYTALTQEQKIQAEVNGILEETRFQTGDAAKLVNTYSGQIALLGYNFQNLKVQVGNAIMPVVQAVLPGINAIISALTKLATVFAQVTALLFGKSSQVTASNGIASSAGAAADATDDLAAATEGAGDASESAAKKMKGVLAGFDELNVLADNASGSVGGAASGIDAGVPEIEIPSYESEIEDVDQLGEAFQSLGELFVKTLDDMLAGMPAFRDALLEFAGNFNAFNQKLYDGFTFDGVKERVQQLGTELAAAFNDMVIAIDWELWGRTLGSGLNLGLQFLVNFLYEFDWVSIGTKLAEFINGLVYEVDWYDFGRLLWTQFKIGLETFAGFILGLDMPALAQAASDIIIGFFNSMQETIANIDWAQIGAQIADFLNNIDWIGVITAISGALEELVGAGLELIAGFIENADPEVLAAAAGILAALLVKRIITAVVVPLAKELVSQIIAKIATEMAASNFTSILSTIGTTIAGIGATIGGVALAASSFFSMWNDGFSWAKEAVMLLGIALAAVGAVILGAPALVAGVVAGVVAAVATAAVLIHEHWEEIKQWFLDMWAGIQEVAASIAEWFNTYVIEPVTQFFSEMWESIQQLASDAWNGIVEVWQAVSEWFSETIVQPVGQLFSDLWNSIGQAASNLWDSIVEIWQGVSAWFDTTVIQPVAGFFAGMFETIGQTASSLWESIKGVWSAAADWFSQHVTQPLASAFDAVGSTIKNTINGLIGNVEGLINSVIRGINWLISQLNKVKFDIPDWVPAIGGKSFGLSIPKVSETTLPRLANGAVIPPNQQFAAILGDQRSGVNIEAPLATIKQAVTEAIQAIGGVGGDINITVESVLDGKVVAKNTVRHINSMTRSSGKSPLYA